MAAPSPGRGGCGPPPPPWGRGRVGSPQQEPRAAGATAAQRASTGARAAHTTRTGAVEAAALPSLGRLSLGPREPQPGASSRQKGQLCRASGLAPGQHRQPAQLGAGRACCADGHHCRSWSLRARAPALSPPRGCLPWGPLAVPAGLEQSCPALGGETPAGPQGAGSSGARGSAAAPARALSHLLRAGCPSGHRPAPASPPQLRRQGCVSAGELAAPAPLLSTIRRWLRTRGAWRASSSISRSSRPAPRHSPLIALCLPQGRAPRRTGGRAVVLPRQAQRCSQRGSALLSPCSMGPSWLPAGEDVGALPAPGAYPCAGWTGAPGTGSAGCWPWLRVGTGPRCPGPSPCPREGGWRARDQPGLQVCTEIRRGVRGHSCSRGAEGGVGKRRAGSWAGRLRPGAEHRSRAALSIAPKPHRWNMSKAPGSKAPKSLLPGPPEMYPFIHNCFLIAFCQLQRDGSGSLGSQ